VTAGDVALQFLGLLVYPGILVTLALGAAAELAVAVLLEGDGVATALPARVAGLRRALAGAAPLLVGVALLAALASTQVAAPFNPVSPAERSLLVAAVALAAAGWLVWSRAWSAAGARVALVAQVCWLVALLAPALVFESLRPQALGAIVVPNELPLKVAAGLLALLCLPALLQVAPGPPPAPGGPGGRELVRASRVFLWLPFCGLFASLFVPAGADDAGGVLRFLGAAAGAAGVAIALALLAARGGRFGRAYPPVLAVLAIAVLAIAAATSTWT
jgi:hypothetical protein